MDDRTVETFAAQEEALLPYLVPLTVSETATAMQHWRARVEVDRLEELPDRALHLSRTLGGRFELSGSLDALSGEVVATALRVATVDDATVLPATRRADALVDVCRFYLDHQHDRTGGRNRPHLNVVVDYDALVARRGGETVDGTLLDGASIQALLCDAGVNRVVTRGTSAVLDYGTTTRVVPTHLWNALVLRDRHCRFDGCDRPWRFCEAHYVVPVLQGGPTSLDNLVLKCSRHHHIQTARIGTRGAPEVSSRRRTAAETHRSACRRVRLSAHPHRPPARLARTAGARRHPGEHRPQGQDPDEPTTGRPRLSGIALGLRGARRPPLARRPRWAPTRRPGCASPSRSR